MATKRAKKKKLKAGHHLCGHPTKKGGPCSRQVPDKHTHCSQHSGEITADPRTYDREARRHEALGMSRAGFGFGDIASRLGVSIQAARELVNRALEDLAVDPGDVRLLRAKSNDRLDRIIRGSWPAAIGVGRGALGPSLDHVDRVLRAEGMIIRLNGLNAPVKVEHSGPEVGPIDVGAMSSEERKVLMVLMAEEATRRSKAIEVPAIEPA